MFLLQVLFVLVFRINHVDQVLANCIDIKNRWCLFDQLNYNLTSLQQFIISSNETEARHKLDGWLELQIAPTCWNVVAPFLCRTYIPKCVNGTVLLPCQSVCRKIKSVCGIIPKFNKGKWPRVLECDDFPTKECVKTKSLKNKSLGCHQPLIPTNYKKNWYGGIKGCGLQCKNHFYSEDEQTEIQTIIAVLGSLSMFCNLFSVATFLIDWKAQSKYPAKIIFFINLCFCLSSCGWLLQFLGDTRRKISCREDKTRRIGEPGSESAYGWCVFSFLLIYYFAFAGVLWYVMLSYAWHSSFRTLGSTKDKLVGKKTYFHVLSWMIPVVSTIAILILEEVDADPMAGICFVGIENHWMKKGFVLVPFGVCLVIGEVLMVRGTIDLFKVKGQNLAFLNGRASTKIKETIIRISFFSVLLCLFFIAVIASHVQETAYLDVWEQSLIDFVRCEASKVLLNKSQKCELKDRPSLPLYRIQMISTFGAGITISTWSWTKATLKTWKKAWIRFRGFDVKKRLHNSFHARRNRRRINPMVEHAFPAIAMAVPLATRAAKRGSVTSIQSQRRGSALKLSSFVSEIADDIRARIKTRSAANSRTNDNNICNSPVFVGPKNGRRRSLLSIESLLTTSSQGKLRLRRSSLQTSAASGSEFGMAFGHMWSVQPQLNIPSKTGKTEKFKNLRVIRLGEDVPSTLPKKEGNEKNTNKEKKADKKRMKSRNKIDTIDNTVDAQSHSNAEAMNTSSVLSVNHEQRYLPPLKADLRQRSPSRWSESRDISPAPSHGLGHNKKSSGENLPTSLQFFHETFIGPSHKDSSKDENITNKDISKKASNNKRHRK